MDLVDNQEEAMALYRQFELKEVRFLICMLVYRGFLGMEVKKASQIGLLIDSLCC